LISCQAATWARLHEFFIQLGSITSGVAFCSIMVVPLSLGHFSPVSQRASLLTLVLGLYTGLKSVQAVGSSTKSSRSAALLTDAVDRDSHLLTIDAIRQLTDRHKAGQNQLQDIVGGRTQKEHDISTATQSSLTTQQGKLSHEQLLEQYNQKLWREAELEAEQESRTDEQLRRQQISLKKAQEQGPKTQQKEPQPERSPVGMVRLWWNAISWVHVCQALGVCLVALCLTAVRSLLWPSLSSFRVTWAHKVLTSHCPASLAAGGAAAPCEKGGENRSLYLYELTSRKYPDLQDLKGDLEARLQAIAESGRGTAVFAVGSAPPGEMAGSCAQQ